MGLVLARSRTTRDASRSPRYLAPNSSRSTTVWRTQQPVTGLSYTSQIVTSAPPTLLSPPTGTTACRFGSNARLSENARQCPRLSTVIEILRQNCAISSILRIVENETAPQSVAAYLGSLDDAQLVADCNVLIDLMQRISGEPPALWNVGTLGFGRYRYRYDSGREGESHTIGFYPRRGKITIYLMDGTVRYSELLPHLGRHTTSRVCLYVKRLSDIELPVLEQIVQQSYDYITSQDGRMHRAQK